MECKIQELSPGEAENCLKAIEKITRENITCPQLNSWAACINFQAFRPDLIEKYYLGRYH
jgi:hypothetical protein